MEIGIGTLSQHLRRMRAQTVHSRLQICRIHRRSYRRKYSNHQNPYRSVNRWLGNSIHIASVVFFWYPFSKEIISSWNNSPVRPVRALSQPEPEERRAKASQFKLICLHAGDLNDAIVCDVRTADDFGDVPYEALSYRCLYYGDEMKEVQKITCSGTEKVVTPNLYAALRQLRLKDRSRLLWVDAICINQDDDVEKSEQVKMMGDIYWHADSVLIWLGPGNELTERGFELIKKCDDFFTAFRPYSLWRRLFGAENIANMELEPGTRSADVDWQPLKEILQNEYFGRTWIVQEVAKSRQATVLCGASAMSWNVFIEAMRHLTGSRAVDLFMTAAVQHGITKLSTISALQERRDGAGRSERLLEMYYYSGGFACSDPRDTIFALRSLATDVSGDEWELAPDYGAEPLEVLKRFAIWYLVKQGELRSLSWTQTESSARRTDCPSWVPETTTIDNQSSFYRFHDRKFVRHFSAAGKTKAQVRLSDDRKVLYIKGKVVGSLNAVGRTVDEIFKQRRPSAEISFWRRCVSASTPRERACSDAIAMKAWIGECYNTIQGPKAHLNSRVRVLPFQDAMICGLNYVGGRPFLYDYISMYILLDIVGRGPITEKDADALAKRWTSRWGQHRRASRAIRDWSTGRRFGVTTNGRYTCVPRPARAGDLLCVLYGGDVPYVLRPVKDGYRILGACYHEDFMDGAAMKMTHLETVEFALV